MLIKCVGKRILPLILCLGILISFMNVPMGALAESGSIGNLVLGAVNNDAIGSPIDGTNYGMNAVDGCIDTMWAIPPVATTGSLTINLGSSTLMGAQTQFSNAVISDYNNTVTAFNIEYYNGTTWAFAYKGGTTIGLNKAVAFTSALTGTKIRLNITTNGGGGISEFELYNGAANKATITVSNVVKGKSPKYVGFSSGGNLNEESNNIGWVKYSKPNTLRLWYNATKIGADNINNDPANIASVADFDTRKALFRTDPDLSTNYNWNNIAVNLEGDSKNIAFDRKLGINPYISIDYKNYSITGTWQEYWDCWKFSYGYAFYMAKNFDVNMFESMNEPDGEGKVPSGFSIATYVKSMQVQSDAVRCAITDVNRIYNKNLEPKYFGPVIYKQADVDVIGPPLMKANRTDYHGNVVDYNIVYAFDRHRYTKNHQNTADTMSETNTMMIANTPNKKILPFSISEWNWCTTGQWQEAIHDNETSDTPVVFSTIGGTLAAATNVGLYASFLFKHWYTFYGSSNRVMYAWGRDREDSKNIARGKPTTVSGFIAGNEGAKAVDGDIREESAWKSPSNSIGPQSIVVDLQGMYSIQYACIDFGKLGSNGYALAPKNATLHYWDGSVWVDIPLPGSSGGGTSANNFRSVIIDPPIRTNKIKVQSTDSGTLTVRDIFLSQDEYIQYVGGPMKSAEVNRMFSTGFQDERDLYTTTCTDALIHTNVSLDPISNNYYVWISKPEDTTTDSYVTVNLSGLDVCEGTQVTVREVSSTYFGDVPYILPIDANKTVKVNAPNKSAVLLTIPKGSIALTTKDLTPIEDTMVSIGSNINTNYSTNPNGVWTIRQSTFTPSNNSVTYMKFNTGTISNSNIKRAVLELRGNKVSADATTPFIIYAFLLDNDNWSAATLTGNNAPNLNKNCAFLEKGGVSAWPIGILTFMGAADYSRVDITDYVKEHPNTILTIALVKDRRVENEIFETDYVNISTSKDPDIANRPKLKLWYNQSYALSNLTYTPNAGTGLISVDVANNTTDAKTANVVYGVYNGKKLVGIKISPQTLTANTTKSLTIPTPIFPGTTWTSIKAFVFDNTVSSIKALCENVVFVKST